MAKPAVIVVGADKGGVGKTTVSRAVLDYFSALVAEDDGLPLTEAALSLAQDAYPDLDLQAVLASALAISSITCT